MKLLAAAALALLVGLTPATAQQSNFGQSGLIGKLENPTIITDPAQWPKIFQEAPDLAEQVKAGKLPPVAERVPQEPMVLKPIREIGKYGGTWRRGFLGPGDSENGNRVRAADKLLFWDVTGTQITPNVAKGYEISADGRRTTLFLRKGTKWSDGSPFTADDFVFWFEDVYQNKDLARSRAPEFVVNGKPGKLSKLDETTVVFEFEDPHFLFPSQLAGDTQVGGGHSRLQSDGRVLGMYAPSRYLKQFLPKYSSVDELTARAKTEGFQNWVQYYQVKADWRLNRDLPTLAAWKMTQPINRQAWVLERNPYFWTVDTAGNQLPYLDKVVLTLAENPEVINLRAIAGEYDYQERFMDLAKLPVFLENAERGGYKVHLDPAFSGSDALIAFNRAYRADPEIQKWIGNVEFRRALALGIDRDQINHAFFLGLGTPGSVVPDDVIKESPIAGDRGGEWRKRWAYTDVALANKMLDSIGLAKKDAQGFRLRTDNGERLRLQIDVAQTLLPSWPQQGEMAAQQWKAIGIDADVKLFERSLFYNRTRTDQQQMVVSSNGGSESLFLFTIAVLPIDPATSLTGAGHALWYTSNGAAGVAPTDPEQLRAFALYRSAASLPEAERIKVAQEIWKIAADQVWSIGMVGLSPAYMGTRVVNAKLQNVPARTCTSQHCRTPWGGHPEQWFYK